MKQHRRLYDAPMPLAGRIIINIAIGVAFGAMLILLGLGL